MGWLPCLQVGTCQGACVVCSHGPSKKGAMGGRIKGKGVCADNRPAYLCRIYASTSNFNGADKPMPSGLLGGGGGLGPGQLPAHLPTHPHQKYLPRGKINVVKKAGNWRQS